MILRFFFSFIVCLFTTTLMFGQNLEPMDLAKKIFSKEKFPDLKIYTLGEYKGRPNGQDLQRGSSTRFLLLEQTNDKAVVAMSILDASGKGLDTYLHFTKDTIWKMTAFRALAMTGIIEEVKNELEKMTPQQVEESIHPSKKSANKKSPVFTSRAAYDFELGNARLVPELDDNIIKHFTTNEAEFERIRKIAQEELKSQKNDGERSVKLVKNMKSDYSRLFISDIVYGDYTPGGECLSFSIGGILDNAVGFLYVNNKSNLPNMSADRVIMLREIGNGWYLYKTT